MGFSGSNHFFGITPFAAFIRCGRTVLLYCFLWCLCYEIGKTMSRCVSPIPQSPLYIVVPAANIPVSLGSPTVCTTRCLSGYTPSNTRKIFLAGIFVPYQVLCTILKDIYSSFLLYLYPSQNHVQPLIFYLLVALLNLTQIPFPIFR